MKKHTTTIGIDLGEKEHFFCVLNQEGEMIEEGKFPATKPATQRFLADRPCARIAMETGTHSPWVSRMAEVLSHEVIVGNARKLRLIYQSTNKNDCLDARSLARMARFDPQLLYPIHHRGLIAQHHLAILKSRDSLVRARTLLINSARGLAKCNGERLPKCSADCFATKALPEIPEGLQAALAPMLRSIADLTEQIKLLDRKLEKLSHEEYPETETLRGIRGVGAKTALAFVLVIEEKTRFAKSRDVPAYLGLVPRRDQSGGSDRQLRITKTGDEMLRRLLVTASHYILGPFGEDSDLRRWGLALCERGGKNGKKRAVVALARKLAVVLHRLWTTGEEYHPFLNASQAVEGSESEEPAKVPVKKRKTCKSSKAA